MALNAANLDRRIQIIRFVETGIDSFGNSLGDYENIGDPISARRRDVSDVEKMSAGRWNNLLVVRFVVRATVFSRDIRRTDRLRHDGTIYQIAGIKEFPERRSFLEITAQTSETS